MDANRYPIFAAIPMKTGVGWICGHQPNQRRAILCAPAAMRSRCSRQPKEQVDIQIWLPLPAERTDPMPPTVVQEVSNETGTCRDGPLPPETTPAENPRNCHDLAHRGTCRNRPEQPLLDS